MAKTIGIVNKATSAWKDLTGVQFFQDELKLEPLNGENCTDLAKRIKQLLSQEIEGVSVENQMSFQSIKKLLPNSCRCQETGLIENLKVKLLSPPPQLPYGYAKFAKKIALKLFPRGWDRTYVDKASMVTPPISSTIEDPRSFGGSHNFWHNRHSDYVYQCLNGPTDRDTRAEVIVVQSAGKPRPLTKYSARCLLLKPLHDCLYDSLSRKEWLLRGDVTAEKMRRFKEGNGKLVSGDYKSATDNLPIEIAELVLHQAIRNSEHIPPGIQAYAEDLLRPCLYSANSECAELLAVHSNTDLDNPLFYEKIGQIETGQMMGSLMSFPLLCAQNYIAFRWALRCAGVDHTTVPVLINGDDILYQEPFEGFSSQWISVVSAVGLEVEKTKTSIEQDYGTINSTLLRWRKSSLVPVHTFRFGMLRRAETPHCLGKSFDKFVGPAWSRFAWKAANIFFDFHSSELEFASLDKYGFRGSLSYRLAKLWELLPYHEKEHELPPVPCWHDVVMPAEEITVVGVDQVCNCLIDANLKETIDWRWSADFLDNRTPCGVAARKALKKCMRTPRPMVAVPRGERGGWRKDVFSRIEKSEEVRIWLSIYENRADYCQCELLPPYLGAYEVNDFKRVVDNVGEKTMEQYRAVFYRGIPSLSVDPIILT